jgi:hypothetical protein
VLLRGFPVKERNIKPHLRVPAAISPFENDSPEISAHLAPPKAIGPTYSPKRRVGQAGNVFRLSISCSDIKNPNSILIRNYFSKFCLKTSKHNSFLI